MSKFILLSLLLLAGFTQANPDSCSVFAIDDFVAAGVEKLQVTDVYLRHDVSRSRWSLFSSRSSKKPLDNGRYGTGATSIASRDGDIFMVQPASQVMHIWSRRADGSEILSQNHKKITDEWHGAIELLAGETFVEVTAFTFFPELDRFLLIYKTRGRDGSSSFASSTFDRFARLMQHLRYPSGTLSHMVPSALAYLSGTHSGGALVVVYDRLWRIEHDISDVGRLHNLLLNPDKFYQTSDLMNGAHCPPDPCFSAMFDFGFHDKRSKGMVFIKGNATFRIPHFGQQSEMQYVPQASAYFPPQMYGASGAFQQKIKDRVFTCIIKEGQVMCFDDRNRVILFQDLEEGSKGYEYRLFELEKKTPMNVFTYDRFFAFAVITHRVIELRFDGKVLQHLDPTPPLEQQLISSLKEHNDYDVLIADGEGTSSQLYFMMGNFFRPYHSLSVAQSIQWNLFKCSDSFLTQSYLKALGIRDRYSHLRYLNKTRDDAMSQMSRTMPLFDVPIINPPEPDPSPEPEATSTPKPGDPTASTVPPGDGSSPPAPTPRSSPKPGQTSPGNGTSTTGSGADGTTAKPGSSDSLLVPVIIFVVIAIVIGLIAGYYYFVYRKRKMIEAKKLKAAGSFAGKASRTSSKTSAGKSLSPAVKTKSKAKAGVKSSIKSRSSPGKADAGSGVKPPAKKGSVASTKNLFAKKQKK